MITRKIIAAALVAAFSQVAFSHGVWVASRVDAPTIVYGHGAEDNAYDPQKITVVQGYDHDGKPVEIEVIKNDKNAVLGGDADFHTIALVMDNGYWTQDNNGKWVNKPKNEVENAKKGGHYLKNALNIQEAGKLPSLEALSGLENFDLVIIPEVDVTEVHEGDEIPVTVYFQGQPLPKAEIVGDYVNSGKVVATTDANGKAKVPVRNQGLNVISVDHSVPTTGAEQEKADKVGYNSTLSFSNDHHDD